MKLFQVLIRRAILPFLAALSAAASDFVPDPSASVVEVAVHATADNFTAHLDRFQAAIKVDEQGLPTAGSFAWDFKDLNTHSKRRDKEMLHWLEHDKAPDARFIFDHVSTNATQRLIHGKLVMHGATNQMAFPISIQKQGKSVAFESSLQLDHRPYALPQIVKLGLLRVDPVLKVHFKLSGSIKD